MAAPEVQQLTAFEVVERFGPVSVYTIDETTVLTKYPVLRRHENGGITLEARNRCISLSAYDIAGNARTDRDGRFRWRLADFACNTHAGIEQPVSVVATPHSGEPLARPNAPQATFVTTQIETVGNLEDEDVLFTVLSWHATGDRAPNVPFSFRCRIPYRPKID